MMFYDERIEQERAKIARRVILIATLYALVCGALRFVNVARNMDHVHTYAKSLYFLPVGFEITVCLTGLICLAVCSLSWRGAPQDERTVGNRARLWRQAEKIHLYISLGALAVFYPLSLAVATNINFAAIDTLSVALHLFLLLTAVIAFELKERQIFLHYAAQESPRYGLAVLKGIGRLAVVILCALGVSVVGAAVGELWLHTSRTPRIILSCFLFWLAAFLLLAPIYLLLSLLERISYTKRRVLSGAAFAILLSVILLKSTYSSVEFLLIRSHSTTVQKLMMLNLFSFLPIACGALFCLFLIYLHSEYRESGTDRLSRIGFLLVLGAEILGGAADFLLSLIQMIFIPQISESAEIGILFGDINNWQAGVTRLVFLAGFVLLIVGPVRRGLANRGHIVIALLLSVVALGIEIFLYTQSDALTFFFASDCFSLLRHLYLLIFFKRAQEKLDNHCAT